MSLFKSQSELERLSVFIAKGLESSGENGTAYNENKYSVHANENDANSLNTTFHSNIDLMPTMKNKIKNNSQNSRHDTTTDRKSKVRQENKEIQSKQVSTATQKSTTSGKDKSRPEDHNGHRKQNEQHRNSNKHQSLGGGHKVMDARDSNQYSRQIKQNIIRSDFRSSKKY